MRLTSVSIVEGGPTAPGDAPVGSFELRVERGGWTLSDPLVPGIETHWSWDDISGLAATGGWQTSEGEPATALDVIVNGWPVRLVVPADQLPDPGPVLLTMLAPAGHVLRGTGLVTQAAPSRRRDDLLRLRRPARSQPLPLRSVGTAGLGVAAAVAVMVAGTVIAAAILVSGSTPSTVRHDAAPGHGSSTTTVPSVPGPDGAAVGQTGVAPAVGASGGVGGVDSVPVPIVTTTTGARATSAKSSSAKSNGTKGDAAPAPTHSGDTTASGTPTGSTSPTTHPTSPPTATTAPAAATTTTTTKPSTTTTTSTRPSTTTTTRPRRPTTTTTTRPPVTTTTTAPPPPTTTAPPPPTTTTAPPPATTTTA